MQHKATLIAVLLVLATLAGACSSSKPSPTAPSIPSSSTGTSGTVSASTLTVTGFTTLSERGESRGLSALVTYSDGSVQDRTASSVWSSANEAVVTVNAAGLVTAVNDGHTMVRATFGNLTNARNIMVDLP
jgi:phospholipase/lecithinase/hemolysin